MLLGLGTAAVLIGMPTSSWWQVLAGGVLVAVTVGWHASALWRMLRKALPSRFRITVRYYLWAAVSLLFGIALGVTLAAQWEDPWQGRLLIAHALTNVLGWIGLTLTGTLLTLWPTMLRTRMDPAAEKVDPTGAARAAPAGCWWPTSAPWPVCLGWRQLAWLATCPVWSCGLSECGVRPRTVPRGNSLRLRWPQGWAGWWPVWFGQGCSWSGAPDWVTVREDFGWSAVAFAAAGVQVLSGALSYLLPSVLGWWAKRGSGRAGVVQPVGWVPVGSPQRRAVPAGSADAQLGEGDRIDAGFGCRSRLPSAAGAGGARQRCRPKSAARGFGSGACGRSRA